MATSIARVEITGVLGDVVSTRNNLLSLSAELRHSSDALTRWARAYVVTRDVRYRELATELLEVREGKRGRPQGNAPIYWNMREWAGAAPDETAPRTALDTLAEASGANPEEIGLLRAAKEASSRLVRLEQAEMQAADDAGPAPSPLVLDRLFDRNFVRQKEDVMLPIERFTAAVTARTDLQMQNQFLYLRASDYALAAAAFVLLWSLLTGVGRFRSVIGEPLAHFAARIHSLAPETTTPVAEQVRGASLSLALQSVAVELKARDRRIDSLIGELRRQQERERLLIENAPVAIAMFDAEMRYLAWSTRWMHDYGLEGSELAGHSHYEIFPDLPEKFRVAHREGLAGKSLRADEDQFEHPKGKVQVLRWQVVPWRDHDGSVGGILVMTEDVTQTVRQREELQGWTRVFEDAQIGIARVDPGEPGVPRILDVNPHLAQMLGMTREELRGTQVSELVPEDLQEPLFAAPAELERTGHISFESAVLTRDGRRIPVLLDITQRTGNDAREGRRIVFVLELTEHHRLMAELEAGVAELQSTNQRLRVARDEAIAASSTRNAILSNMSHELRTPLNHILGFSHLLESSPLDAKARDRVQRIHAAGGVLLHLVSNLLDAVRVETGTLPLNDEDFDLRALLDRLANEFAPALRAEDKHIEIVLAQDVPARLRGDPQRLAQALHELLDNAIKFSERGAVALSASRRATDDGKTTLHIEVQDRGIGVTAEQQRALFSWFAQREYYATRSYGGVGMGLVLAQRIIALMDGTMGYRATPGGGSTFWLELPMREAQPCSTDTAQPDPAATRTWLAAWISMLGSQDISAVSQWRSRPGGLNAVLGARTTLLDTAMHDFDFEMALELAKDTLAALSATPEKRQIKGYAVQ